MYSGKTRAGGSQGHIYRLLSSWSIVRGNIVSKVRAAMVQKLDVGKKLNVDFP